MAEGQEIPDREEDAGSLNSQPESPAGPSDAQSEALENLAGQVDDNKVEAAGKQEGLRAALVARFDVWSREAAEIRNAWGRIPRSEKPSGIRSIVAEATMALAEKTTAFLRDRLQPKAQTTQSSETPASK